VILETAAAPKAFAWDAVSAVATATAALFAAYAAWQSKNQVKAAKEASQIAADAAQIQVFENIFRDIQQQEQQFYGAKNPSPEDKALRDRMFFNTINYLAFLLDSKILRKIEFLDYFRDAFLYWWTLFEREVPEVDRNNPRNYPEFRRIVCEIKNPPPKFQTL
jgi:hypothetical protein